MKATNITSGITGEKEMDAAVENMKTKLYYKLLAFIPVLKDAMPFDDYSIGKGEDGAIVKIQSFNKNPDAFIDVDIVRRIGNKVEFDEDGQPIILEKGSNHAPTISFRFYKKTKKVQATSIWDDRPGREYNKVMVEVNKNGENILTGAEKELNEKLYNYINEFIDLGYNLRSSKPY